MRITYENCLEQTGYKYDDLLAYTGVFGIHRKMEFIELDSQKLLTHTIRYDVDGFLRIEIKSTKIHTLDVSIRSKSEVFVEYFRLVDSERGNGLGFKRLISQIEELRGTGFTRIRLFAFGDIDNFPEWDGYIVWAKFGFTMYRKDEMTKFAKQMTDENITSSQSVNDLVLSQEGTALWKYIGSSWKGKFELDRQSPNMKIFTVYRKKKKL